MSPEVFSSEPGPPPAAACLVASLTEPPTAARLATLPLEVEWLEVRADLVGELEPEALRRMTGKKLLYTLRSAAEGGASEAAAAKRRDRLSAAAVAGYDFVDLEAERDLSRDLLERIAPERRVLSWHGGPTDLATLEGRFAEMERTPAAFYKLVPTAAQPGEEWAPLLLLASLRRPDVAAFAAGAVGAWTRLLAPRLGAPLVYGAFGTRPAAPGQIAVERLVRDYGLPALPPIERLYGIAGQPVAHSLSPRLHNQGYRALGIPALYLPFHVEAFGEFWLEVVEGAGFETLGWPLVGLSVTTPHKDAALAVAAGGSPLAQCIGAANTLVLADGAWAAETTDPEGVVLPLVERGVVLDGLRCAVVGAGGAGRAAAAGLASRGARVVLVNRDVGRGLGAAAALHLPFVPLADFDAGAYAVVVNATSLGRDPRDPVPFHVEPMAPGGIVVDLVYGEAETLLAQRARGRGLMVIEGREVLLAQARVQFRLMTGGELPLAESRRALGLEDGR